LSIRTENAKTARYIYQLLLAMFAIKSDIQTHMKTTLSKNRVYTVYVDEHVNDILARLDLADGLLLSQGIPFTVKQDREKSVAYLRGAFLSSGSVSSPETGKYHLEIASTYQEHAHDLMMLLFKFRISSKILERKNKFLIYLSNAESILDFLSLVGASKSRFKYEDIKMMRELRNNANRQANAEAANIAKVVNASQDQIVKIKWLLERGLMPENLQQTAEFRVIHPESSLAELAEIIGISKSALNHRFRKITQLYESYQKKT
jgi:DNA-binding protein WhiA